MIPIAARLQGSQRTLLRRIIDAAPPGAINLGLGQPVVEVPTPLARAAANAAHQPASYSPNAGLSSLRSAIASRYGRHPDEVIVTVGAEQALFLALAGSLNPGDEVLVPDPGFPVYSSISRWCGAEPISYTLRRERGWQLDPDEVFSLLTPRTRLVVLNTPANPTGVCHGHAELTALLEGLRARGVAYLSDEVYSTLAYDAAGAPCTPPLPSTISPRHGMIVNSLSKQQALMGWRLGWLIAPSEACSALLPLHQMIATCAPVPSQRAAEFAFSEAGAVTARQLADTIARRRQLALHAVKGLPAIPTPCSDGALYLFLDASRYLDGDDVALAHALLDDGVIVIPGQGFGPNGRGQLRVAFGVEPDALHEGLRRLASGLRRLSSR